MCESNPLVTSGRGVGRLIFRITPPFPTANEVLYNVHINICSFTVVIENECQLKSHDPPNFTVYTPSVSGNSHRAGFSSRYGSCEECGVGKCISVVIMEGCRTCC